MRETTSERRTFGDDERRVGLTSEASSELSESPSHESWHSLVASGERVRSSGSAVLPHDFGGDGGGEEGHVVLGGEGGESRGDGVVGERHGGEVVVSLRWSKKRDRARERERRERREPLLVALRAAMPRHNDHSTTKELLRPYSRV